MSFRLFVASLGSKVLPRRMREWIVMREINKQLVAYFGQEGAKKLLQMTGWKTRLGGVLGILTGLTTIGNEIYQGSFNFERIMIGVGAISAALAAMGIGHKVEKAAAANNPAAPAPVAKVPESNPFK